eukprot:403365971
MNIMLFTGEDNNLEDFMRALRTLEIQNISFSSSFLNEELLQEYSNYFKEIGDNPPKEISVQNLIEIRIDCFTQLFADFCFEFLDEIKESIGIKQDFSQICSILLKRVQSRQTHTRVKNNKLTFMNEAIKLKNEGSIKVQTDLPNYDDIFSNLQKLKLDQAFIKLNSDWRLLDSNYLEIITQFNLCVGAFVFEQKNFKSYYPQYLDLFEQLYYENIDYIVDQVNKFDNRPVGNQIIDQNLQNMLEKLEIKSQMEDTQFQIKQFEFIITENFQGNKIYMSIERIETSKIEFDENEQDQVRSQFLNLN